MFTLIVGSGPFCCCCYCGKQGMEVDAPGQHIQAADGIAYTVRGFPYPPPPFPTQGAVHNFRPKHKPAYHSVTAMLVKRFNVVFNLTQFYSETCIFTCCLYGAINNIPVSINLTEVSGTVIEFSKGIVTNIRPPFREYPVSAHDCGPAIHSSPVSPAGSCLPVRGCNHSPYPERLPDLPPCRLWCLAPSAGITYESAVDGGFVGP